MPPIKPSKAHAFGGFAIQLPTGIEPLIQLSPGEKRPIQELTSNRQIDIVVNHTPADIDIAAFGLNAQRQIEDDRYTVLFSNARSPEGAISLSQSQGATTVSVDLDRVPSRVDRITVTATHDSASLSSASTLHAVIADCATLDAKPHLGDEKVVMLLDLYRHSGQWRLGAVIQGFAGGMAALITHFGGEVADEAPAPAPAQSPTASPAPSAPISLAKVDLRKRQVGVSLKKLGIEHEQAEVLFVIDGSGSMARLYSNGTVQETVERIAPVALRLDNDGTMATWYYASRCKRVEDLTATNLDGFVARTLPSPGAKIGAVETGAKGFFGGAVKAGGESIGYGNNEPVVMNAILDDGPTHCTKPLLVVFLTDGGIDRSTSKEIIAILRRISNQPIFWQFVGVGNANYGVLRELDTISGRVVDNAGFFSVDDLSKITDDILYDRILSEFPAWLKAARGAGILR